MKDTSNGIKLTALGILVNLVLAVIKTSAGIVGHSYALVADGIESISDIFSSFITWNALRISAKPPDKEHPYGHGKAESLASLVVSLSLFIAAGIIAFNSIQAITHPKQPPEWYTLVVLLVVIATKEKLFRKIFNAGSETSSTALETEAWHHRSDAITSAAAFIGISIALVGGENYATADDWAALVACGIIAFNGIRLISPAINEVMDATIDDRTLTKIRHLAGTIEGVQCIEKCRARKSGTTLYMDIHVQVDPEISVKEGHSIAHKVKDILIASEHRIEDVVVHIEPGQDNH